MSHPITTSEVSVKKTPGDYGKKEGPFGSFE